MIGQFIQATTDIGLACIQCDLTSVCRVELVQIAVFLHGKKILSFLFLCGILFLILKILHSRIYIIFYTVRKFCPSLSYMEFYPI